MRNRSKTARLLVLPLARTGMRLAGLAARAGMFFGAYFTGLSPRARLLVLLLRAYRFWSSQKPIDQARARKSLEALGRRARTAARVRFEPVDLGSCRAEWAIPSLEAEGRAILFFHGGGFTSGSLGTHRSLVSHIAKAARTRLLHVDYRLAPEWPFPAALEDARAAHAWLLASGYAPGDIALSGDSAGGGLAASLLVDLRDRGGSQGNLLPAGAVLLSPWLDLSDSRDSWRRLARSDWSLDPEGLHANARAYLPASASDPALLRDPLVSPAFAELSGLPPLMIHAGGLELLREDARAFADRARAAGVKVLHEEWPGMVHDWHSLVAYIAEGRRAVDEIGVFLRMVLS